MVAANLIDFSDSSMTLTVPHGCTAIRRWLSLVKASKLEPSVLHIACLTGNGFGSDNT